MRHLPQATVDKTYAEFRNESRRYGGKSNADWHFDALMRILDRKEPDYRD